MLNSVTEADSDSETRKAHLAVLPVPGSVPSALPPFPSKGTLFFFPLNYPAKGLSLISPPPSFLSPPAHAPPLLTLTMNAVHPYSDAQALVYSPQYTDSTHHHRPSFHPSMSAPWSPPAHTLLSSSTADHSRMYSLMHQPIHTLPYSAPSSAVFYNHHHHSNPQHQPRMQLSTPVPLNFTGPQIESSIGPQRGVLTRRQARAAQPRGAPSSAHQENESTSPSESQDVRCSISPSLILISQLNYCHLDASHPVFAVTFTDAR